MTRILLVTIYCFITIYSFGQTRISSKQNVQDSICKYGKKYEKPERKTINFPSKFVTDEYKIKEIHKAIPDSFASKENNLWWLYDYFFISKLVDYDPISDTTFTPKEDNFLYKLKDTYFFDINGDSLLDFIHYPKYYMTLMRNDIDAYELYLKLPDGYKLVTFRGYIIDIKYHNDGALAKMTTYQGPCCLDNQSTFYSYSFDRSKNELVLTKTEQILTCQLLKK